MGTELFEYTIAAKRQALTVFADLGARTRRPLDFGYRLHMLLTACFAETAPTQFSFVEARQPKTIKVLAYGDTPWERMREKSAAVLGTAAHDAIDWTRCRGRRVRSDWSAGMLLRYAVTVCPVRRRTTDGRTAERDAFSVSPLRHEMDGEPEMRQREVVYEAWLAEKVGGAVALESCEMDSFRFANVCRRDAKRRYRALRTPRAELSGVLRIVDVEAFSTLLARGIGRHRAFGFGMLRLDSA